MHVYDWGGDGGDGELYGQRQQFHVDGDGSGKRHRDGDECAGGNYLSGNLFGEFRERDAGDVDAKCGGRFGFCGLGRGLHWNRGVRGDGDGGDRGDGDV